MTLGLAEQATDRELLARFVATGEQAAFAALVQRHGAGVLRVCRRVLGNEHDAEDVFQATFLVLARKAGVLSWHDCVGHWLRAVAQRLALQARGLAERRRGRESADEDAPEPCDPGDGPPAALARRELCLVLDEELGRLPEKYRAPVVLCYLQGKTNEQAAGELGWPAGSMSRRLARARALLHDRLSRRGLALVVVLCGLALGAWGLRTEPGRRPAQRTVAEVMAPFRGAGGGEGIEDELLRLAEGGPAGMTPAAGLRAAHRAAQAAEAIHDHDPGRQRQQWRRLAAQMRRSALDLAEALEAGDERGRVAAARRLTVTCQTCHATFRD
jgi:RNA polymerase sigma-70 factor (ECF subfamily)